MTNIVSGVVSTITDLGKDEAFLQGWLKEQPSRLGLGELEVTEGVADEDDRSFAATDDDHCFSVDVQLGEMEASRGFQVLDNWARNRVQHPDKTHVAVLVTEAVSDRYETTLQTLAEHLPLVVVELQVWKGENEAIVIPHVRSRAMRSTCQTRLQRSPRRLWPRARERTSLRPTPTMRLRARTRATRS